jgi:site-specific DNA-methyltransferase (adenine-specific)
VVGWNQFLKGCLNVVDMSKSLLLNTDALSLLQLVDDDSVRLIWTDPPFGTNDLQKIVSSGLSYSDLNVDSVINLFRELIPEMARVLKADGTIAVCLDYRTVHQVYCLFLEFGLVPHREIIWTFGLGNGGSKWWANKHNTVLLFGKSLDRPFFNADAVPLVERKSRSRGYGGFKKIASVWDITLSNAASERVGYPSQKPESLIKPFVLVHTEEDDFVLDPFGGSGTTAAVAQKNNRRFITGDISIDAVEVMIERLNYYAEST